MLFLISLTIGLLFGLVVFALIVFLDRSLQQAAKRQPIQVRQALDLEASYPI